MDDRQATERYRYMLRTAPPEDIERAHAEAFERLTPEQRQIVLRELAAQVPPSEVPSSADTQGLARMATRAEMREPGTMERTFSRLQAGPGLGGIFLSTLAGAFVGTAIADAFFGGPEGDMAGSQADQGAEAEAVDAETDPGDAGFGDEIGAGGFGDMGGGDFGDFGGGFGDI